MVTLAVNGDRNKPDVEPVRPRPRMLRGTPHARDTRYGRGVTTRAGQAGGELTHVCTMSTLVAAGRCIGRRPIRIPTRGSNA